MSVILQRLQTMTGRTLLRMHEQQYQTDRQQAKDETQENDRQNNRMTQVLLYQQQHQTHFAKLFFQSDHGSFFFHGLVGKQCLNVKFFMLALHVHRQLVEVAPLFRKHNILKIINKIIMKKLINIKLVPACKFLFAFVVERNCSRKILASVAHRHNAHIAYESCLRNAVFYFSNRYALLFNLYNAVCSSFKKEFAVVFNLNKIARCKSFGILNVRRYDNKASVFVLPYFGVVKRSPFKTV